MTFSQRAADPDAADPDAADPDAADPDAVDPDAADPDAVDPAPVNAEAVDAEFFARDTREVARDLIGATLEHGGVSGRIVETEAYRGDPASHFVTRPRTGQMMRTTFGRLYVYSIYGIHRCVNVTTERDHPGAVLLRALEPLGGIETMRARRGNRRDRELASGPAKLFVALGLSQDAHERAVEDVFTIRLPDRPIDVVTGPRVGISRAVDLPWRFMERDNPHVSRGGTRRRSRP